MVTRDTLKSGVNLPVIGQISLGGLLIVGGLFLLFARTRSKKREITLKV